MNTIDLGFESDRIIKQLITDISYDVVDIDGSLYVKFHFDSLYFLEQYMYSFVKWYFTIPNEIKDDFIKRYIEENKELVDSLIQKLKDDNNYNDKATILSLFKENV